MVLASALSLPAAAQRTTMSGGLVPGGDVSSYQISPDGQYAVFLADKDTDNKFELYSVRLSTGSIVTTAIQTLICAVLIQVGYFLATLYLVWRTAKERKSERRWRNLFQAMFFGAPVLLGLLYFLFFLNSTGFRWGPFGNVVGVVRIEGPIGATERRAGPLQPQPIGAPFVADQMSPTANAHQFSRSFSTHGHGPGSRDQKIGGIRRRGIV